MEVVDPPFQKSFKTLFQNYLQKEEEQKVIFIENKKKHQQLLLVDDNEKCGGDDDQLPVIDLSRLSLGSVLEREKCKREIVEASKEWGFFQVVNHGISHEILEKIVNEQVKLFRQSFDKKANGKVSNFSSDSYRWGTPAPTSQFSWSEAFHIPLAEISRRSGGDFNNTLRLTIEEFATTVSELAQEIAGILAENVVGYETSDAAGGYFAENCLAETCYLRLNRYPPCPISSDHVFGLMPHTDSDFLTILYQDQVGGLQLVKDGRWVTVNPNPKALIINIGDLFQAWSNGLYRSVEHRVMTNKKVERFSVAYFLCPSYETVIQSCGKPPLYRKFSFREFRQQVQEDVQKIGYKIGLPRDNVD
ncbi:Oxoglutarate/iron-dependent dioxygenase [Macleaya cordata]|uniref:gibberellin 2beta-dioxygenase n=1 Tax=Macleaya cordata TaxID=56857 RepID=A0A200QKY7_MACCD|nr:Oxoglutarate/iron-dependent dioxygenase [Macleaya cordata]